MIAPLALTALLAAAAAATPDAIAPELTAWAQALGAPGAEAPVKTAFAAPPSSPAPIPVPLIQTLNLSGLLDRHWTRADSFTDAAGKTAVSATLDLAQNGWLVVVPPGGSPRLVKMASGMSDRWTAKGQTYQLGLQANIFSQYDSVLTISNAGTGAVVWQKSIAGLFALVDKAGLPVVVGGLGYRVFLSHLPAGPSSPTTASKSVALALVYDSGSGADQIFMYSVDALTPGPVYLRLLGGVSVYARLSPDLSTLDLAR
jgi:hypothetical protein